MNTKKLLGTIFATMALSTTAMAGDNTLTLSSDSGVFGGTVQTSATWAGGATDGGWQADINYDPAVFTPQIPCTFDFGTYTPGTYLLTCTNVSPGVVRLVATNLLSQPFVDGSPFTVIFDIDNNGPAGSYPVTLENGVYVTPTTEVDGTFDVVGPSYDSAPIGPNATIDFTSIVAGTTNAPIGFDIDNNGATGTTLSGDCQVTGADSAAYILTGGPVLNFDVAEAGPNQNVEVACDSENLTPGTYNAAALTCSHNGGPPGPGSAVNYPLNCTILDIDRPTYSSTNPAPGGTFDFGKLLTSDGSPGEQTMTITNTGTDQVTGLTGDCSIFDNPNGAYSVTVMNPPAFSGGGYGPLPIGESATATVQCDNSIPGDHNGGVLRCSANDPASNQGNFDYTLNCQVNAISTYDSTPTSGTPLTTLTAIQGNGPGASESLVIENTGEAGSFMSGTCALTGPDSEITLVSGGSFVDIAMGATQSIAVQCEGDVGSYSNNLACTPVDPVSNPGTYNYPVNCDVAQPDPAIYASAPYAAGDPGDLIDVNEGNDPPPVNNGITPSTVLTISNAASAGDDDLVLQDCSYSGDAEITAAPGTLATTLAPGESTNVTFTCATDTVDVTTTFSGTYTCPYDDQPTPPPIPGIEGGPQATYPVECDVREQYSQVDSDPADGTTSTAELMPNEEATFTFTFTEVIDEALDAEIDCSVSGPDFAITTNAGVTTVPAGGSVDVVVTFTDPGQGDSFSDTLVCDITDNQPPAPGIEGGPTFNFPLEVTVIGRNATFEVTKDFDDDNPLGVDVALDCNTGLPLFQTGNVHDGDAGGDLDPGDFTRLEFVVVDFNPGELDCEVYELAVPAGYEVSYEGSLGDDGVGNAGDTDTACTFDDIESADFVCEITNTLQSVDVTVNKVWIDENQGYQLPEWVEVQVECFNLSDVAPFGLEGGSCNNEGGPDVCFTDHIDPANPGQYQFFPHWDGSSYCSITEFVEPGFEKDDSECANIPLAPGQGGECTIVNTRIYEGIPTLSQYGLMLMALMMLGVGLVAFRRYS